MTARARTTGEPPTADAAGGRHRLQQAPLTVAGVGSRSGALTALQRSAGNRAVVSSLLSAPTAGPLQRAVVEPAKKAAMTDYDNTQYRVSGPTDNRLIEVVERGERDNGAPYYRATGKVIGFTKKMPRVDRYDEPRDLGDWAPRVTHVNGMQVAMESGMKSAEALLDSVRETVAGAGGEAAIDPSTLDVLFTYSAKRSNIGADIWNCLKGKAQVEDAVTESQETTMLDAVAAGRRIHVSAHSRGTIKTDNAVRTVFKTLVARYKPAQSKSGKVIKEARRRARDLEGTGLMGPDIAEMIALDQCAEIEAEQQAKKAMDDFIQLVYGGNAVSYPSSVLQVELFVGSRDFVSLGVGTYTKSGAKWASGNKNSVLHKQKGGHGYTENYAKPVGEAIGADLATRG